MKSELVSLNDFKKNNKSLESIPGMAIKSFLRHLSALVILNSHQFITKRDKIICFCHYPGLLNYHPEYEDDLQTECREEDVLSYPDVTISQFGR